MLPCGKSLAIPIARQISYGFFKTISRKNLEKLLKDARVIFCRIFHVQLKTSDIFDIAQNPTLTINPGNFDRTVVRKKSLPMRQKWFDIGKKLFNKKSQNVLKSAQDIRR